MEARPALAPAASGVYSVSSLDQLCALRASHLTSLGLRALFVTGGGTGSCLTEWSEDLNEGVQVKALGK